MTTASTIDEARPPRVLVLEDQVFFSQLLGLIFASAGYEATVVRTGRELLAQAQQAAPDVVVLDIDVADINGLDVLAQLRRTHAADRLPIMMASARGERSYARRAKALGANLFLKKPYSIGQILGRVEALLAHARPADEDEVLI